MSEQHEPGEPDPSGGAHQRQGDGPARGGSGVGGGGAAGREAHTARGVHRPHAGLRAGWRHFTQSPFFPASVLVLIVAAAAGLFAGSYTYAMADPTPRDIPAAVVSPVHDQKQARAFVNGLEKELGSSLKLRHYRSYAQAKRAVEDQEIFTVLRSRTPGRVEMNLSSAAGASVAEVLREAAPKVGERVGVQVTFRDLKPLGTGDPRGLTIFYITLAAGIIGFIGAIQLSVNVPDLTPAARLSFIAVYAVLGGFVIAAVVGWLLKAVTLPFVHSWLILSLTMFTSAMVFQMFNTLVGRWAMIPTWLVMVLIGNPSSGGAVSWPLLPSVLGAVGRWLPPGASVNAQHTAVYFPDNEHLLPYLVLAAWALAGLTVFVTLDGRLREGPDESAPASPSPA